MKKTSDRIKPGFVINDRFEIIRRIGEGGFAVVFEGRDTNLDRRVAIKVLHGALVGKEKDRGEDLVARFKREARLAATVDHECIVNIYDAGMIESHDEPFIVMEYLQGASLHDVLQEQGPIEPEVLLPLFWKLLIGLGFAHEAGIVHKDLKPDNIFYKYPGTIRESFCIVDFGIAHIGRSNSNRVTKDGEFFGTPSYMAPEYIVDQKVGPELDIYQMGLILAECLVGKPVFFHPDSMANLLMHLHRAGKVLPDALMESDLGPLIACAINMKPQLRYRNAMEFAQALHEIDPAKLPSCQEIQDSIPKEPKPSPHAIHYPEIEVPQLGSASSLDEDSEAALRAWLPEQEAMQDAQPMSTSGFGALSKDVGTEVGEELPEDHHAELDPPKTEQTITYDMAEPQKLRESPPSNLKVWIALGLLGVFIVFVTVVGNNAQDGTKPEENNSAKSSGTATTSVTLASNSAMTARVVVAPKIRVLDVLVATEPSKARVLSGQEVLGESPLILKLKEGESRTLRFEKEGHDPLLMEVTSANSPKVLYALKPLPKVEVGRKKRGSTPKKTKVTNPLVVEVPKASPKILLPGSAIPTSKSP